MESKAIDVEVRHKNSFPGILSPEAINFVGELVRKFRDSHRVLLAKRKDQHERYQNGLLPNFCQDTQSLRNGPWHVAPIPDDIRDRRVEITGPPDRKMVINALNSGANVFMADFEDSLSPTWDNLLEGQQNLKDAVRGVITYNHPTKGQYTLCENPAVLFVRPRGLHLFEKHFFVDSIPAPACLFDFGLYMWHNAKYRCENGTGPYFYLPKLEHYKEARWWNTVFIWAQKKLEIPTGSIRATVLLETLPAAFQMDEILWELRSHSAGLNCGRWDYIFSYIKTVQSDSSRVLPDRGLITMESHFMKSYAESVIQTCHRRGVHAIGGMAAQIPIKGDDKANEAAMKKVRKDKLREVRAGHDGTWVAHPGLVSLARDVFDQYMWAENQITRHTQYECTQLDLLEAVEGNITIAGLQHNVDVGIRYLHAWLNGNGCVPLYHLMEDAATAEISRVQVWQWLKHKAVTDEGIHINLLALEGCISDCLNDNPELQEAAQLFRDLCTSKELPEFLTLSAYERIVANDR